MALSITGGAFKGRRLQFSAGKARPTSAKLRQALFDILGPIDGLSFCDLFAGTGIVGLEALSRGADSCSFVEADKISARAFSKVLLELNLQAEKVQVFPTTVKEWLKKDSFRYNLIFADPPFIDKIIQDFLSQEKALFEHLAENGLLILQLPSGYIQQFPYADCRRFGDEILVFLEG